MSRYSYSYFYENYYSPIYDINYFVNFKLAILNDSINLNNVKKKKRKFPGINSLNQCLFFIWNGKKKKRNKQTNEK